MADMTTGTEKMLNEEARLLEDPSFRIRTLSVFNELCDVSIDITGLSTDQIVEKILFEIEGNEVIWIYSSSEYVVLWLCLIQSR